ncbi:P-loop containing nucleoside triphosphate hydrolase protein [Cyathus striatus]|nr:P-loop containing nucleoside triphosphate hydrolase protein [Cyathus striatus]
MTKRAPFIVIEGLDRSGKTTQLSLLHAHLLVQGVNARLMKFPDRTTTIGKMIDSYLKSNTELDDRAIHLLFSANRWEMKSTIESLLLSGTPILCDRYAFSGIAFSTAKSLPPTSPTSPLPSPRSPSFPSYPSSLHSNPSSPPPNASHTSSLSYEWCLTPDIGLPAPDLTIFLDIDPDKALRSVFGRIGREMGLRTAGRVMVEARVTEVGRVTEQRVEEEAPPLLHHRRRREVDNLDASRGIDVVAREVWKLVEPLFRDGVDGPVGRLWEDRLPLR